MSATIVLVQDYGSSYSGYKQEIGKNIFYLISHDDGTVDKNSSPIRIPDSGVTYSYEVWIRARCDYPPTTKCFNFKVWYNSGTVPTGQKITVNSDIVSEYDSPVNIESTKGTRVDFTTKNSELNSIPLSGELVNVGDHTSYLVFQLEVLSTATPSESSVDFIVQYDEV